MSAADASWLVEESGFDRSRANFHETLFTVGNGRLGTRGSLEEGHLGQLSGTFLGGVYDGYKVTVIDLVNVPDWVDTAVFVESGSCGKTAEWVQLRSGSRLRLSEALSCRKTRSGSGSVLRIRFA